MDSALFPPPPEFLFFFLPGRPLFSLKLDKTSDGVDWIEEGWDMGESNADRDHLKGTGGGVGVTEPPPAPGPLPLPVPQIPSSRVVGLEGLNRK